MSANRLKLDVDNIELLFSGWGFSHSTMNSSYPVLWFRSDRITASGHVNLLGVDISSNLGLNQHIPQVSTRCFYRPHQLLRIQWSLDPASTATLVCALLTSRIDYCSIILANVLSQTSCRQYWMLHRVLSAEQWSLTAACHNCCMMNSTRLVCLDEFFLGWLWRCISVWMAAVFLIWIISSSQSLPSPYDICAHPIVICW